MVHNRPLRPRGEIVFKCFNTHGRSFCQRFNCSIGTIANVSHNLMPCRSPLREETISNALHITFYQKLSCYLHLNSSPSLPFSNVNVSSSVFSIFNVNIILSPLIDPV